MKYCPVGKNTVPPPFAFAAEIASATASVASRPTPGCVALTVNVSAVKGAECGELVMLTVDKHGVSESMNVQRGILVPAAVFETATG